ncbi:hypothetical protein Arash_gp167c [Salmonella phage Arash]|nr:hypothetical protein Arash_gp167c [Salmonella phage Arash]
MKKLQISGKEFIRFDGLYYNLTDLFRLTTLGGIRLEPWGWAQSENRTRDISRRGWFFKKSWAKVSVLIEYAHYLSPHLYRDVLRAVDMDDEEKLIAILGERKATRLDLRVESFLRRRRELKAVSSVLATKVDRKVPAEKMQRTLRTPTRSMSHSRSMGPSIQHHNSEPDYLTQAMLTQAVLNNWDDSSHRSHSSHSRHDDVCSTPSYSSHDSHSSSSWSGDSGGSYDSGSSGGCD